MKRDFGRMGAQIHALRVHRQMPIAVLARKIKVSVATLDQWELGNTAKMRANDIEAILKALNGRLQMDIPPRELLTYTVSTTPGDL